MDLAKIRKKSLSMPPEPLEVTPVTSVLPAMIDSPYKEVPVVSEAVRVELYHHSPEFSSPVPAMPIQQSVSVMYPERIAAASSPLAAILAGRTSAGCDEDSADDDSNLGQVTTETCQDFLCFRISDEIYGINIMEIKEIIKPREVTEIPRAPVFVSGILSLRGVIIPIIDMRIRLKLMRSNYTGAERIIVIKNNNSFTGLLVDEVVQVVKVQLDTVESAPTILEGIDRDFISGLGRADGLLIIILDLEKVSDISLY